MDTASAFSMLVMLALLFVLYFLPSFIAAGRGHNSRGSIFVVNLFLGWTFIVWVLCLAWSFGGNTEARDERLTQNR